MRFKRAPRVEGYKETSRKRAAVLVSQRHAREKFPLFADLIAETQPSVDEVIAQRHAAWPIAEQKRRDELARRWREARAMVFALPDDIRAAFLTFWNNHRWLPGDPGYLMSAVAHLDRDYVFHDGKIVSRHTYEWELTTRAKFAAMTDAELDHLIQTHFSPLFLEWGRDERRKRFEARAADAPAPAPRKTRRRR